MRARRAEERGKRGGVAELSSAKGRQGRVLVGSPDSLDATRCDLVAHPRRRTRRETPTRDAHAKCSFTPSRARTPPPRTPTTTTNNQSNQSNRCARASDPRRRVRDARAILRISNARTHANARTTTNACVGIHRRRRRRRRRARRVASRRVSTSVAQSIIHQSQSSTVDPVGGCAAKTTKSVRVCVQRPRGCVQPTAPIAHRPSPIDESRPNTGTPTRVTRRIVAIAFVDTNSDARTRARHTRARASLARTQLCDVKRKTSWL